jgi:ferrous iron transport protein B
MGKDGAAKTIRVALAGNPNAGKTSLFNVLTGSHHKVGNYPGVTVEKIEGSKTRGERTYRFIDLPGIYSLTAYSIDEVVARDFLIKEKPDLIVDVLDSTNLERNLFLCLQFQELGIPVVGALNMSDEAEANGVRIDDRALSALLGIEMVRTVGTNGRGVDWLLDAIDRTVAQAGHGMKAIQYGEELESRILPLEIDIRADGAFSAKYPARWLAVKLLEKDAKAFEIIESHVSGKAIAERARMAVAWLESHFGKDAEVIVSEQRYAYIRGAVREAVSVRKRSDFSLTEKIDKVIMNRFLALPLFALVLWGVFQVTFSLGAYPQGWLETLFGWLGSVASRFLPEGLLRSVIVDGIIAGVGSVFSFVPLIVILFMLLSLLEDVGYMSRAAFACDKALHAFGLHGQSVFPLMLGFGCSVPAMMAARTLKSPRDRIVTILVIPFMSCGAKLPVYVLLAGAFFPRHASLMVMLMYALGVVISLVSATVLKKTVLKGAPTPFVMELPPYRAPTLSGVLWHVWEKTASYVKKMGTVIMTASILVWAITTFPMTHMSEAEFAATEATYLAQNPGADEASAQAYAELADSDFAIERSAAGYIGKFIQPVFAPIGFDWKLSIATITGFAAKEAIVSTMGILYRAPESEEGGTGTLESALRADPSWSPLLAIVLMIFTLAIPPCVAALATIKGELGWKWLCFEIVFLLAVGWVLGFAVFQVGSLLGLGAIATGGAI